MRILWVTDLGRSGSLRHRAIAEGLDAFGSERLLVVGTPGTEGAESPREPSTEVWIDLGRFEGRTTLEGLAREFRADLILAAGLPAALGCGQLEVESPLWLDLEGDLVGQLERLEWLPGTSSEVGKWHRLLWALDRADRVSCATAEEATVLRALLGLRGRLVGADGVSVETWDGESTLAEIAVLREWLEAPSRARAGERILGRAEIADHVRLGYLGELSKRPPSPCERVARRLSRVVSRVAAAAKRCAGWVASCASVAALGAEVGARRLAAAFYRAPGLAGGLLAREANAVPARAERVGSCRHRRPRVLVVFPYPLLPPRHGGAVRLANLLPRLARDVDLFLLLFDQHGSAEWQCQQLERYCRRVYVHHWQPDVSALVWTMRPSAGRLFVSEAAALRVRDIVVSEGIDVVQIEYSELAGLAPAARPAKVVLVAHELAHRAIGRRRRAGLPRQAEAARHFGASLVEELRMLVHELRAAAAVAEVQTMSQADADVLGRFRLGSGARMRVVPNGVDTARFRSAAGLDQRSGVLLAASFLNPQNLDGAAWFLDRIWPRILELAPDARVTLAGASMPESLRRRSGAGGIEVAGEVPDLLPLYHHHRVLVVPLRYGAGTRLKIAEGFAAGIAVVSTTLGAEGLDVVDRREALLADAPDSFAACVLELLRDDDLWRSLTARASERAEDLDWGRAAAANLSALRELSEAGARRRFESSEVSVPVRTRRRAEVSVIIAAGREATQLERLAERVFAQRCRWRFELLCLDSGAPTSGLRMLREAGARVIPIGPGTLDFGLVRDFGAGEASGEVLVFLDPEALPLDEKWLERLVAPLFEKVPPAAVQGGIFDRALDEDGARPGFYWGSSGRRFNFTRESREWVEAFEGVDFSTVNAAIRRAVWRRIPFGSSGVLEGRKWQAEISRHGWRIHQVPEAAVAYNRDFDVESLWLRCAAEGAGCRMLGRRYRLRDAIADVADAPAWREPASGATAALAQSLAARLFPVLRPLALWWGNSRAARGLGTSVPT